MANNRGKVAPRLIGASSELFKDMAVDLHGVQFGAPWLQKMAAEGYMYKINAGTRSTPITGNGVYVATTPDLNVRIPSGVLCMPTRLEINYETVGTSGIQECFAMGGNGGTFATSSNAITPVNIRSDLGNSSGLLAQAPATGAAQTGMTNVNEFFRNSPPMGITKTSQSATVSSIDPYRMVWSALDEGEWPMFYTTSDDFAQIMVWMGGQAPTGFISLTVVIPPLA